ncbi:MAG: Smr/MutS family protein [Limisphaerales bacterium]
MSDEHDNPFGESPVELPIDGVLDLHPFRPREVNAVVTDYLAACQERRVLQVRIIHGKGIGALKRTVHHLLERHSEVIGFHLDSDLFSGAGATIVQLRPPSADRPGADQDPGG